MILTAIFLIIVGALAAASWIASKQPNAKAAIDKLVPIQGILGIIAGLWGVWALIDALRATSAISSIPIFWTLLLVGALLLIGLGFILGYGLIASKTMAGNPEAMAKGEAMRLKLVKFQTPMGLAAIVVGLVVLIMRLTNSYF